MWTKDGLHIYVGDCAQGDRAATVAEKLAFENARAISARKTEILAQLELIDKRSIRPAAEGDAVFLAQLRAPCAMLRAELAALP